MTKVGDVRVVPAKLGKGFVVEQLAFFNADSEPTWVMPNWEERGLGGLGNVFRSREKAQIAGLAWRRLPALDSRGSEMKTTLTDLKPKPERKPSPWAYTPEKTRFQLRRPIKAAPIPQTKKPTSMKPFLLMITGLLFCFTGVGLIIGIPMVLAGLAMGAYAIIGKRGVLIIGAILLGLYLLGSIQHAHAGEKIAYSSRVGQELVVVSKSGIDTPRASISAVHSIIDARKYCIQYEMDKSSKCANSEMRVVPYFVFTANCNSGVFVTPNGHYQFRGPWQENDNDMAAAYSITNLANGDTLEGDEASGYSLAAEAFQKLCPSSATAPMFVGGEVGP